MVAGLAFGFAIDALVKPVVGSQLYVVAPLAEIGVEVPEQMAASPAAITVGEGFTVIVRF